MEGRCPVLLGQVEFGSVRFGVSWRGLVLLGGPRRSGALSCEVWHCILRFGTVEQSGERLASVKRGEVYQGKPLLGMAL